MGVQSGANLTGMTVSSQSCELETSSVADCDAKTTPPPVGGGLEAGAQESPSTSDIELEYNVVLPDKGKENGKEHLVSQDEMKVMIACDHTQCIAIQQQDWTMLIPKPKLTDPYLHPDSSLCPVTCSIPASCSIVAKRPSPLQPSALPSHDFHRSSGLG